MKFVFGTQNNGRLKEKFGWFWWRVFLLVLDNFKNS